jgi:hypothetical protein
MYLNKIGVPWTVKDLSDAKYAGTPPVYDTDEPAPGPSVAADGVTSVFTVDGSNGHLYRTWLAAMGGKWQKRDLSDPGLASPVAPVADGIPPVAIYLRSRAEMHVFSVDKANRHLRETILWGTNLQYSTSTDLTQRTGLPAVSGYPSAVQHDGYLSVYTRDDSGNLDESFQPPGGSWAQQNLSATGDRLPATPRSGVSPVAIVHSGWVSVYTVDQDNAHLRETYLPAAGGAWATQDMTKDFGAPVTKSTPGVLVHDGYTSVFTQEAGNKYHTFETYLPAIGLRWANNDLPAPAKTTRAVPVYHSGSVSVFNIDVVSQHAQETKLDTMGLPWRSVTGADQTSTVVPTPYAIRSALLHYDASGGLTWTSLYTVDASNGHLDETNSADNKTWWTQDLTNLAGTPPLQH